MEHVGKRVSKFFPGYGWFEGLVEEVVDVQGVLHARVEYQDGDQEDISFAELEKILKHVDSCRLPAASLAEEQQPAGPELGPRKQEEVASASQKLLKSDKGGDQDFVECFPATKIPKRGRSHRGVVVVPLGCGFSIRNLPRMHRRHRWEQMSLDQFKVEHPMYQSPKSHNGLQSPYLKKSLAHCIDCGTHIREMKAPRRCRTCYQREYRRKRQKLNSPRENGILTAGPRQWEHASNKAKVQPNDRTGTYEKKAIEASLHDGKNIGNRLVPYTHTGTIDNGKYAGHVVPVCAKGVPEPGKCVQEYTDCDVPGTLDHRTESTKLQVPEREPNNLKKDVSKNSTIVPVYSLCLSKNDDCPYTSEIHSLCVGMQATIQKDWQYFPGKCNPVVERYIPKTSKVIGHLLQAGLVKLGEKVWYRGGHNKRLAEGWIVWNGIVCGKCSHVMGPTEFEKCAGARVRKPGKHIIFSNEQSLLELTRTMSIVMGSARKSEFLTKHLKIEPSKHTQEKSA